MINGGSIVTEYSTEGRRGWISVVRAVDARGNSRIVAHLPSDSIYDVFPSEAAAVRAAKQYCQEHCIRVRRVISGKV